MISEIEGAQVITGQNPQGSLSASDTILLVCDDELHSTDILGRLYDAGLSAVGPIPTAGLALALAAVTAPTMALVARPPTGRRGAVELAETLLNQWNIPSILLCEPDVDGDVDGNEPEWSASAAQLEALHHALKDLDLDLATR
jgi:hypothetical protein